MLNLQLREEFLGPHMPGTALSLRRMDKTGAAGKSGRAEDSGSANDRRYGGHSETRWPPRRRTSRRHHFTRARTQRAHQGVAGSHPWPWWQYSTILPLNQATADSYMPDRNASSAILKLRHGDALSTARSLALTLWCSACQDDLLWADS